MDIDRRTLKAVRYFLELEQEDVAAPLGLTKQRISAIEKGKTKISKDLPRLVKFYEDRGIEFLDHSGFRLRPSGVVRILKGYEGFQEFIDDVYNTVKNGGGNVCVTNADERQFEKWQGAYADEYIAAMSTVPDLTFQILVREGDDYYTASKYARYRQVPEEFFSGVPTYVYGNKKAEIIFHDYDVTVFLFENKELADAQRKQFQILWEAAR